MRSVALFALLALTALVAYSATVPNTPADGDEDAHPYCMLKRLQFTNGLRLTTPFHNNVFNYECEVDAAGASFSTVVQPKALDLYSSVEIKLNGKVINSRALGNAISNRGDVAKSPRKESDELHFVDGHNEIVVGVACNQRVPCYYEYKVKCRKPAGGGGIVGDPQFVGLRGQSFQVHGVSGEIYNIVSDSELQYNARFIFLDDGECPVVNGRKLKGCWSHPGSYLGELGLKTRSGDRIRLQPGAAAQGFDVVEVNGRALAVEEVVQLADDMGFVSLNSTHLATVSIGNWEFQFENSDRFVNQRVKVMDARRLRSHGLLGQTWRQSTYPNPIKYVQGVIDDYLIRDRSLFADSFLYNAFN